MSAVTPIADKGWCGRIVGKIGSNVSSGCIRMLNDDVIDLYERTPVGTKVVVLQSNVS